MLVTTYPMLSSNDLCIAGLSNSFGNTLIAVEKRLCFTKLTANFFAIIVYVVVRNLSYIWCNVDKLQPAKKYSFLSYVCIVKVY